MLDAKAPHLHDLDLYSHVCFFQCCFSYLIISHLEVAWHPGEREAAYKRAA